MSEETSSRSTTQVEWDSGRIFIAGISVAVGIGIVVLLNIVSAMNEAFANSFGKILVNFRMEAEGGGPDLFAPQNFMWVAFFFGLGDLLNRYLWIKKEHAEIDLAYLPEDERTLLTTKELPVIYKKVRTADRRLFLPRMISRIVVQFQKSNSVEQSNSLLNSSLELLLHEVDLRYTVVRYTNWIIPTLGFLGTVIGISAALSYAGSGDPNSQDLLSVTTLKLGVAFYTTGVALGMSGILVLAMNLVQASEERALNRCGQYCLENLINKLFEKSV